MTSPATRSSVRLSLYRLQPRRSSAEERQRSEVRSQKSASLIFSTFLLPTSYFLLSSRFVLAAGSRVGSSLLVSNSRARPLARRTMDRALAGICPRFSRRTHRYRHAKHVAVRSGSSSRMAGTAACTGRNRGERTDLFDVLFPLECRRRQHSSHAGAPA